MRELERQFPALAQAPLAPAQAGATGAAPALIAALHAAQALAGAGDLGLLAATLLRGAIGHAGATDAALVLRGEAGDRCVAKATLGASGVLVEACDRPAAGAVMPGPMLHSVLRTRENVLLDDALASARYRDDPYVVRERPRALLCIPLLSQGVAIGVLYLENRHAPGVFAAEKVLMLELIAAQGAAALENVRLAQALAHEKAARSAPLAALREHPDALPAALTPTGGGR